LRRIRFSSESQLFSSSESATDSTSNAFGRRRPYQDIGLRLAA